MFDAMPCELLAARESLCAGVRTTRLVVPWAHVASTLEGACEEDNAIATQFASCATTVVRSQKFPRGVTNACRAPVAVELCSRGRGRSRTHGTRGAQAHGARGARTACAVAAEALLKALLPVHGAVGTFGSLGKRGPDSGPVWCACGEGVPATRGGRRRRGAATCATRRAGNNQVCARST